MMTALANNSKTEKRGRGRPRKQTVLITPKRPRGRPRKNLKTIDPNPPEIQKRKRGRPKKSESTQVVDMIKTIMTEGQPLIKRGRPRKIATEVTSEHLGGPEMVPPVFFDDKSSINFKNLVKKHKLPPEYGLINILKGLYTIGLVKLDFINVPDKLLNLKNGDLVFYIDDVIKPGVIKRIVSRERNSYIEVIEEHEPPEKPIICEFSQVIKLDKNSSYYKERKKRFDKIFAHSRYTFQKI